MQSKTLFRGMLACMCAFGTTLRAEAATVNSTEASRRIDDLIERRLSSVDRRPNPPAKDSEFVRRVYLDAIGRIPTWEELSEFYAGNRRTRRNRLIAKLTSSPGHVSHMFNWLGDMLRVKDEYHQVGKTYTFHTWLKEELSANRPWDKIVHQMLTAEGRIGESGPTAYLLRDASMPLDSLSNTLTTFLGANVACAQCHDHPFADWSQKDFYQMAAFFGPTVFERIDTRKAATKLASNKKERRPIVNLLQPNMESVFFAEGRFTKFPEDYAYDDAKPGDYVVPKFIKWEGSRRPSAKIKNPAVWREQFADWLTSPDNPRFAAAISNRLWKKLFGLAVKEPVTDLDVLDDASNPELLEYLAELMRDLNFDLREFQRVVMNTKAYQRQASPTPEPGDEHHFEGPLVRRMTAEQVWDSIAVLMEGPEIDLITIDKSHVLEDKLLPFEIPEIILAYGVPDIREKLTREQKKQYEEELRSLDKKLSAYLKRQQRKSNGDKGNGQPKRKAHQGQWVRASEMPQPMPASHFLRVAGQSSRDIADDASTEGGITETLALMNGNITNQLTSSASPVVTQARKQQGQNRQVLYLYAAFLGRPPTDDENRITAQALRGGGQLGDIAWALVNSREFIFVQ